MRHYQKSEASYSKAKAEWRRPEEHIRHFAAKDFYRQEDHRKPTPSEFSAGPSTSVVSRAASFGTVGNFIVDDALSKGLGGKSAVAGTDGQPRGREVVQAAANFTFNAVLSQLAQQGDLTPRQPEQPRPPAPRNALSIAQSSMPPPPSRGTRPPWQQPKAAAAAGSRARSRSRTPPRPRSFKRPPHRFTRDMKPVLPRSTLPARARASASSGPAVAGQNGDDESDSDLSDSDDDSRFDQVIKQNQGGNKMTTSNWKWCVDGALFAKMRND